jgi:hypothetical protein
MKRLGTSFGSAEPQEPYPLPCLNLITLITLLRSLRLRTNYVIRVMRIKDKDKGDRKINSNNYK